MINVWTSNIISEYLIQITKQLVATTDDTIEALETSKETTIYEERPTIRLNFYPCKGYRPTVDMGITSFQFIN